MAETLRRRDFLGQVGLGSEAVWAGELLSRDTRPTVHSALLRLDAGQLALLGVVAEGIVPTTNTPGALSAGVPAFIRSFLVHDSEGNELEVVAAQGAPALAGR